MTMTMMMLLTLKRGLVVRGPLTTLPVRSFSAVGGQSLSVSSLPGRFFSSSPSSSSTERPSSSSSPKQKRNKNNKKTGTNPQQEQQQKPKQIRIGKGHHLFVACLPGLEPILSQELKRLGILHSGREGSGGFNIREASVETLLRCHLYLGTASHVFLRCGRPFLARTFPELVRRVSKLPWQEWLPEYDMSGMDDNDSILPKIRVVSKKSKLMHTTGVAERVQRGIERVLGRTETPYGDDHRNESSFSMDSASMTTEDNDDDQDRPQLLVRVYRDKVQLSIDTSATPLHQRGYRLETGKAPLREDIAHAMLLAGGCGDTFHNVMDPFCGSGTLCLEAATILAGLPPGRLRSSPLQGTVLQDVKLWDELKKDAEEVASFVDVGGRVLGSDRDEGVIQAAKNNADRAGVLDRIDFVHSSVSASPWFDGNNQSDENVDKEQVSSHRRPDGSLLVATNPPYGKRLSKNAVGKHNRSDKHLWPLYQTFGKKFQLIQQNQPTEARCGALMLTHDTDLARRSGLAMEAKFTTDHGGLKVSAMKIIEKAKQSEERSDTLPKDTETDTDGERVVESDLDLGKTKEA